MSNLKTDYKDDVFTGKRKYTQVNNGDGTISFNDVTEYAQVGDSYGAAQINETNDIVNNLNEKTYKSTNSAETAIADNDYFPFYDSSANTTKKSLWSNIKNVLANAFAIKNHASNTTAYGTGNANLFGHVKLSDNYASSSGAASAAVGASSKAVNDAYNANKNSISSLSGTVSTNATTETTHYNELKGELTANSKRIYMDYKNGKYGINTSANRGADTFIPFNSMPLPISIHIDGGADTNDWSVSTTIPAIFIKNSGAQYVSAKYNNVAEINVGGISIGWGAYKPHGWDEKVAYDFSQLDDTDTITLVSGKSGTVGSTDATFTFSK